MTYFLCLREKAYRIAIQLCRQLSNFGEGIVISGILLIGSLAAGLHIIFKSQNLEAMQTSLGVPTLLDKIMAIVVIIVVLEMARRTVGYGIMIITVVFIVYTYFGSYLPGFFGHRSPSLGRMLSHFYLSLEGIYGFTLGLSATYVFIFVLFASFVQNSYAGTFLIDLAFALTRRLHGGPAQAAVVSSAFMGSLSGAATANVVGTGSITISSHEENRISTARRCGN